MTWSRRGAGNHRADTLRTRGPGVRASATAIPRHYRLSPMLLSSSPRALHRRRDAVDREKDRVA